MLLDQVSIHSFIQNNHIKTESGQDLDFHTHRYLYDIYRDESQYLCCIKAGQIGFSTLAIIKTTWTAKNKGLDIGYILPTVEMVQKFVGSKVNRIAQQNPVIQSWYKDKDSISQKQIGENYIFYLGAQTDRSAIMLSLDMLVADEYDKAPAQVLETYDSRLQHSKYGYKWVFSNPTLPDMGVDKYWNISDQKKWHILHSCGEAYPMEENCIDYAQEKFTCPKCKGEITDEQRRMGEWIATANGKWSGYWIPLWISPLVSASKIAEHKRTKSPEYFANFVAGLPYVGSGNIVSEQTILQNIDNRVNDQEGRVIIAVDTGLPIYYIIGNKQGLFMHGKCKPPSATHDPYDELETLLKRFPRSIMIADQGGDLIGIRKLQGRYPGRVYLCWFRTDQKSQQLIRWGEGDEQGKVLVDRNRAIQMVIDEFTDKRITINGYKEEWMPYVEHWKNIYKVKDFNGDEGDPIYGWRWVWKRKGDDHWAIATVYWRVGMDRFMEDHAKIIGSDPLQGMEVGHIFIDGGMQYD